LALPENPLASKISLAWLSDLLEREAKAAFSCWDFFSVAELDASLLGAPLADFLLLLVLLLLPVADDSLLGDTTKIT